MIKKLLFNYKKMSSDSDDEDIKGKLSEEEESFSDDKKLNEKVSTENSQKKLEEEKKTKSESKKEEKNKKEDKSKEIPKEEKIKKIEEEKDSESESDSSEKVKTKKKKENKKEDKKEEKKIEDEKDENIDEDKKEEKKNKNKNKNEDKKEDKDEEKEEEEKNEDKKEEENNVEKKEKKKKVDKKEEENNEDKEEEEKKNEDKKKEKKIEDKKEENKNEDKKDEDSDEDKKEEKKDKNKKAKRKESSSSSSSSSSEKSKKSQKKSEQNQKEKTNKKSNESEEDKKRKNSNERRQSQKDNFDGNNNERRDYYQNNSSFRGRGHAFGNNVNRGRARDYNNNNDRFGEQSSNYKNESQQKNQRKFDKNEIRALNKIVADNIDIINEMKITYPGFTQLECASIFKKVKATSGQTIFEIMNQIQREILIQITLNECDNRSKNKYLMPSDPFEIIDQYYNNPEHVKIMKYYKIYKKEDKNKLPPYIVNMLTKEFFYSNDSDKRRKLIKYPDGGFNYIPIKCNNDNCTNENCIFSHSDNEMEYHPLYYKTKYQSNGKRGCFDKTANDYFNDFRIIYNYKNENIINLIKLLDEKKIAKYSFREFYKKEMNGFKLETFKTLECPSIKNGITCQKDKHLCYYYHDLSERRRPPTLFRYTNEMCPEQKYKDNGKIKSHCKYGDFCNKCHSRYEYYYHKLFFGKAITCMRSKKNGKCIYEETCYGYHPYKEPGYKKTREEIIQEKKDELMDKYKEENELLSELINKYKCHGCGKYYKKFRYYLIVNCGHIICQKCFKEISKKKCPKCDEKFGSNEGEDFILIDFKQSSMEIDTLIEKNYKQKHEEKEQEAKNDEDSKEKEKKKEKNDEEENNEKNVNDEDEANNSMG